MRVNFAFDAPQQLGDDIEAIQRLENGIEPEWTAMVVLHAMSRRQIFRRRNLTEPVRLDGVSYQEERGDEGHFEIPRLMNLQIVLARI